MEYYVVILFKWGCYRYGIMVIILLYKNKKVVKSYVYNDDVIFEKVVIIIDFDYV